MKTNQILKLTINMIFLIISISFLIPILYILSISFSSDKEIVEHGYRIFHANISLTAYKYILADPKEILNSYMISIIVTLAGTMISLLFSTMLAYTMSRPDYRFKNIISFVVFFTMLFNGGLVPTYILVTRYLHLYDSIFALILPYVINAWYVLLLKGFLSSIPISLVESAKIDGAKEFRIFFKIILPLSKPALAAVGLLIAFTYWNDWWLSLLYIESSSRMPLQYLLYRIMANISFLTQQLSNSVSINIKEIPNESARMAMCVLAAGPMLLVFPFFQKHFVKGLTVGSVKG
jgi:putative aldouronate transport system permease protein